MAQCSAQTRCVFGVGPEAGLLRRAGDRIAGGAVKVDPDVDAVLLAPGDRLVDLLERRLVELLPVAALDPEAVIHRQTHEVEAELRDQPEILLQERLSPAGR